MAATFDIFVIMPFAPQYDEVYRAVCVSIQRAVGMNALKFGRLDALRRAGRITSDLRRAIESSKLCIADISEPNPNVYFELGYAVALRKPVICITQVDPQFSPFDIKDYRQLRYDRLELSEPFQDSLSKAIQGTLAEIPAWKKEMGSQVGNVDALAMAVGAGTYFLDNTDEMRIQFMNFAGESLFGVARQRARNMPLERFMERIASRLGDPQAVMDNLRKQQKAIRDGEADPYHFESYTLKHPRLGNIHMEKIAVAVQEKLGGGIHGWVVTHNISRPESADASNRFYEAVTAAVCEAMKEKPCLEEEY